MPKCFAPTNIFAKMRCTQELPSNAIDILLNEELSQAEILGIYLTAIR